MGDPGDVSWVQRVLSGEAPCGSPNQPCDHSRTKKRTSRKRRDGIPPADAGSASKAVSEGSSRRTRETCGTFSDKATTSQASQDSASAHSSSPPPASAAQQLPERSRTEADTASLPAGGLSSDGKNRCQLCKCWVWGGEFTWQTHVSGFAHRQQVVPVS